MKVELTEDRGRLADRLQGITGENVMLCYQCKKCTLGCPSAYAMKAYPARRVIPDARRASTS